MSTEANNIIEKQMRVHSASQKVPGCPESVPMGMLNEEWAKCNHGQTLNRLNERGGLSIGEMICNIERRKLVFQNTNNEGLPILLKYIDQYNQQQKEQL